MIARENRPTIFCTWCRVGKHDCNQSKGLEETHGMKWFCGKCNDLFTSQIQPKMRKFKNIHFEGFDESDEIMNLQKLTNKEGNKELILDEEIIEINDDNEEKNKTPEKTEKEDGIVERKTEDKIPEKNATDPKKTCWFYVNRKCRFGDRCRDEHPEQCKMMMETGKCTESRCKLTHPKICRGIYFEGYCSRRNCWYVHPTKLVNRYVFGENVNSNNYNSPLHMPNANINNNQVRWSQGNQTQNVQMNPHTNNQWNQPSNRNDPTFLDQWPTPWQASRSAKMMISKIVEEVTSKIMSL